MRYLVLWTVALALCSARANAEWLEASGDHFVIYGDQNEKAVNGFAERLELFHAAMAHVFGKQQTQPSPSNRVTVFVVPSTGKVREVTGEKNRFVAGVYYPRAGGSVAVVPKLRGASSELDLSGETILYHEYAHHFMIGGLTDRAFPRWFVEGFAEFFSGVQFKADGRVLLGAPATHRAMELYFARQVPIRKLLDFDGGADDSKSDYDAFYGQSWALYHYLSMAPERAGQLSKYQTLLAKGESALAAAESAFGDLKTLEKDRESYLKRRRINALVIPQTALTIGPISLRKLSAGEAAMMPTFMESRVGVSDEEAARLVPDARKVAALYPNEPAVLTALAEAEFDAGNDDAAIAAADRALALDPNRVNAHIQKGYALAHKVRSGALPKESWKEVRNQFVKANKIENDNPIPLAQFYVSFLEQGEKPTKNAIAGLEWAMTLAPFDASLRWLVVQQMVSDERLSDAAQVLAPLAYSPHRGEHTDKARQLLKEVESRLAGAQAPAAISPTAQ